MTHEILGDIKSGVTGMIGKQREQDSRQREQDSRLDTLESYLRERKMLTVGGGAVSPSTATGNLLKMAAALLFTKEGRTDAFELAGLSGPEKKLVQDETCKALDTGTAGSGGGWVVPSQWWASFVEILRARLCVVKAGAMLMENLSGSPVLLPKQLTSSTIQWIGQNSTLTAADPTFGQISLTPKTMALRAQYSNLLGILSNPAMEGLIRNDFAKVCALELDRVALRGSGASNPPLGLMGQPDSAPMPLGQMEAA